MPKSRKTRHGSGKQNTQRRVAYEPVYTERIGKDALQKALRDKLTIAELAELEIEMRKLVEDTTLKAVKEATKEAYKRQFAVMMRVMRDRFGFGHIRIRRLWAACLDYIHDIDEGLLSTDEMLKTLENEDGITISWEIL